MAECIDKKERKIDLNGFEDEMSRIQEIVAELENGKTSLSDSMKLYEEGIVLIGKCNKKLSSAERRIKILQRGSGGAIEEKDFRSENKDGAADE